jgi:hypothetical protein
MANVFLNLPLPAGNGAGVAVNTSVLGRDKTVTIAGSFTNPVTGAGPALSVQVSNDGGVTWAGIKTWSAIGKKTFSVAAEFMRTFVQDCNPLIPMAANVDVASNDDGGLFAVLPVTPAEGTGATVDVSAFGTFNTVIVDGSFTGALHIDISEDGIDWSEAFTFATNGGLRSKDFVARFMRTRRTAASVAVVGMAVASVGAINDGGGGGGPDEKVKVSATDTVTGFLADKIVAGSGVALTILGSPGDEDLEIKVSGADAGDIVTGPPITVRGATNAEGAGAEIARASHDHRLELQVEDEGALAGARPTINFIGVGVGAVDDIPNDRVNITIPGNTPSDGATVERSQYNGLIATTDLFTFQDGMAGLSIPVPIDGNYWAEWEGEFKNDTASTQLEVGVSVDSLVAVVANSERTTTGNANDMGTFVTSIELGPLLTGQLIRGLFRKKAGSPPQCVSIIRRNLTIFKVQ